MERRPALALAAAGALISAAAVATAAAGLLHAPEPAASASSPTSTAEVAAGPTTTALPLDPVVVVEQRDVYDTFMVQTGTPATAANGTDPDAGEGAASPTTPATSKSGSTTTTTNQSVGSPTTTTVPSSTTTTRPPGVPSDWPADEPIPPMPPGCQKPQLEDDGVWNCDH